MKSEVMEEFRPPIVLLGILLVVVRGFSLLAGQLTAPSIPPLHQIFLTQCYFAGEAALIVGVGLAIWKLLPWFRVPINLFVVILIPSLIFVGLIDLFLFAITGDHLTPSVLRQFVGPRLFRSTNFWEPVRAHAWPIGLALASVFFSYFLAVRFFWKRGRKSSWGAIRWREILIWSVTGLVLYQLPSLAARPGTVERPIEVVYIEEQLGLEGVRLSSEADAFRNLRDFVGLPEGRIWLDDAYPLVHARDPALEALPPQEDLPDIVLILIESLRAECFEFIYPDSGGCEVPYLAGMARGGVVFPRFIANGFPSSEGMISTTASFWPHHRKRIIIDYRDVMFDSIPKRLEGLGYYTLAAEANAGFDGVGFWYDRFFEDRIDLFGKGIGMSEAVLVDQVMERVAQHEEENPEQPIYLQIKTTNPHLPYGTPKESGGGFYLHGETLLDHYRYTMGYIDEQLARLLTWMESRPRGDNLVVIVTGDHSNYLDQKDTTALPLNHTAWVGAWIHGPERLVGKPRRIPENLSQVDLAATLMALVGDDRPTASLGRNMLGRGASRGKGAVMVRPGGYRLDIGNRSLMVDRKRPGTFSEVEVFPLEPGEEPASGVFEEEDLERLWDAVMTVSFLVEQDRVWDPRFLEDPPAGS